jgi:hypothetical protein
VTPSAKFTSTSLEIRGMEYGKAVSPLKCFDFAAEQLPLASAAKERG